jgi:hypothetical protein
VVIDVAGLVAQGGDQQAEVAHVHRLPLASELVGEAPLPEHGAHAAARSDQPAEVGDEVLDLAGAGLEASLQLGHLCEVDADLLGCGHDGLLGTGAGGGRASGEGRGTSPLGPYRWVNGKARKKMEIIGNGI